jgi:HEAT repeat protein
MSEREQNPKTDKKLLENPFVSSLVVPIAIVLVGALIVFGVTRMLSTDRSYKDLVREMQSKTFGNRWVAAYELSKVINTSSIPDAEIPWFIDQMTSLYKESLDPRTREFIIVAVGAMQHSQAIQVLSLGLKDEVGAVQFHALYALGNMPLESEIDWDLVKPFLQHEDFGLRHAALLGLAHHQVADMEREFIRMLGDDVVSVRYAAAMALIPVQNAEALPILERLLKAQSGSDVLLDDAQLIDLQINIASLIGRAKWQHFETIFSDIVQLNPNPRLKAKAIEVLNLLKN